MRVEWRRAGKDVRKDVELFDCYRDFINYLCTVQLERILLSEILLIFCSLDLIEF